MKYSKSTILRALGLTVLGFFILLSYTNNHIFLDKIIVCSFILCMVLFAKTRGENTNSQRNGNNSNYTNFN